MKLTAENVESTFKSCLAENRMADGGGRGWRYHQSKIQHRCNLGTHERHPRYARSTAK